jgi:hypothetical protein
LAELEAFRGSFTLDDYFRHGERLSC